MSEKEEQIITDVKTGVKIVPDRDNRMTEFAKKLIKDYYLKDGESIQEGFTRASFAWCGNKPALAQRIYDAVSKGYFMFASPVLSNAPEVLNREEFTFKKERGLPISCFLSSVDDTLEGLISNSTETRWLSVKGGGVGINFSRVRSANTMTPGTIPFICTYDTDMEAYKQGRVRRGSIAIYMDVEHPDLIEFLNLRIPSGDESRKCHSAGFHNGINISDNFMKAVIEGSDWNFIDPHTKEIKDTIGARELWERIMEVRYRTGEPYIHFIDTANKYLPLAQKNLGLRINNSNLCLTGDTNITIMVDGKEEVITLEDFNEKFTMGYYGKVLVKSYDIDNDKIVWEQVTNSGQTGIVDKLYEINGIHCTNNHKVFTQNRGYIEAHNLNNDDVLVSTNGTENVQIRKIKLEREIPVFDITVNNTHNFFANDILVHNCAEIELPTNNERTAVCCLSSLNIEKYDEWKNTSLVQDLIEMLDNVLDYFINNAPDEISKARYSAMCERSVGLGTMGFHYLLQKNMIAFESQAARKLNKEVFKHIHDEAIIATKKLGIEKGECPDFITDLTFTLYNGSKLVIKSSDIVTIMNRNEFLSSTETKRAFEIIPGDSICQSGGLVNRVEIIEGKHPNTGWRNANLESVAPTANSAILCGTSPSIEPSNSNAYLHQTRAGSWPVHNPYLEKLLIEKNLNNEETWRQIINSGGTIQHMEDIFTEEERNIFKTAFELNQNWAVKHAADRQEFITQGQSINLFFDSDYSKDDFSHVHIMAWKLGLKSLYYTRTKSSARPDQISKKIERVALVDAEKEDSGECVACQG